MPLVAGRFPTTNALWSIMGQPTNAYQSDIPARGNYEYLGLQGRVDTAASLVTQVMTVVPIPVTAGTVVSNVSVFVGATAAGTPTNSWVALYAGTTVAAPPLIGQSTDKLTGAIAASATYTWAMGTNQLITQANAPNGYIFAAIMVKATTVPSLVTVPTGATACEYAWFTNSPGASFAAVPGAQAFSAGAALTTAAPATLVSVAQKSVAPLVFLT